VAETPTLEMYGCEYGPLDAVVGGWAFVGHYVVGARCSTGCHVASEVIDAMRVTELLPRVEHDLRAAFARAHHG